MDRAKRLKGYIHRTRMGHLSCMRIGDEFSHISRAISSIPDECQSVASVVGPSGFLEGRISIRLCQPKSNDQAVELSIAA